MSGSRLDQDDLSQGPLRVYRSALLTQGVVQQVELRRSEEGSTSEDMVILQVRAVPCVSTGEVLSRYEGPEIDVSHAGSPPTTTYRFTQPWGRLSFAFADPSNSNACVHQIVVDRTARR